MDGNNPEKRGAQNQSSNAPRKQEAHKKDKDTNLNKKCEEREQKRKAHRAVYMRDFRASLTPEQVAKYKEQNRLRARQRYAQKKAAKPPKPRLTAEEIKERKRQSNLRSAAKHSEEEKQEKRRKLKERLQETLTSEQKEDRRRKKNFYGIMKRIMMTPEDKAKAAEYQRNYLKNLTGEARERFKERMRKNFHKQVLKHRDNYSKFLDNQNQRVANETPERRQKRLRGYRINQARKKLRKQLEEEGASPEEIQRRVDTLVEEMKAEPLPPLTSQYKPRGRKASKVLERLQREEEQSVHISSSAPTVFLIEVEVASSDQCEDNIIMDDFSDVIHHEPADLEHSNDNLLDLPHQTEDGDSGSRSPQFTCSECHSSFSTKEDLITHLILFHSEACWKCPRCSEVMINPHDFFEHFKTHQEQGSSPSNKPIAYKFSCFRCTKKFETLPKLSEHVKRKHPKSFWPCENCQLLKYSKESLQFHRKVCTRK